MHSSQHEPVFILSAGPRTGSTMLQRALTSTGRLLIWGESGGALNHLNYSYQCLQQMLGSGSTRFNFGYGGNGSSQFSQFISADRQSDSIWIACMNPSIDAYLSAVRQLMLQYYGQPSKELGYSGWGIKEVLSDMETAMFLRLVFPKAKFIYLLRHPIDCLGSIKQRDWMDQAGNADPLGFYCKLWSAHARAFGQASFGLVVYYEKLLTDKAHLQRLADYLSMPELLEQLPRLSQANWAAMNQDTLSWRERWRIKRLTGEQMIAHGYY